MAPKAADCKNVHNPNLQCKNDFLPYFDGFFLSLLKVYNYKIIFSWPLCIFGSEITKKNVSLIFYPKIPNPPPLRPLCGGGGDICCCPEHSAPLTAKARSRTKIKKFDCKFQAVLPLYICPARRGVTRWRSLTKVNCLTVLLINQKQENCIASNEKIK